MDNDSYTCEVFLITGWPALKLIMLQAIGNHQTSAGTIFGPMFFISYFHDAPDTAKPKFVDDASSVAVGLNVKDVEYKLQISTNEMEARSNKWGMDLNLPKTNVMLFGNVLSTIKVTVA